MSQSVEDMKKKLESIKHTIHLETLLAETVGVFMDRSQVLPVMMAVDHLRRLPQTKAFRKGGSKRKQK